ncbi:hypothetical protein WDJ97_25740, partial [Escherichia coli]
QNDVTLKMPAFEWVHVQLHQQKGMISLSPPTICNSARQDIVTLVKRQLTREISEGRFTANREAVKREVERRVKERMILSRNRNYSRLATASP